MHFLAQVNIICEHGQKWARVYISVKLIHSHPVSILFTFPLDSYDFLVVADQPSAADFQTKPSLTYVPFHAQAAVTLYNLPQSVCSGLVLNLDGPTTCRIMRGNITRWDDPAIVAINPGMNFAAAAGKPIIFIGQQAGGSTNYAYTTMCNKIDPVFAEMGIFPAAKPNYPTHLFGGYRAYPNIDIVNNAVSDSQWTFAISLWNSAKRIEVPISNYITSAGEIVSPNANSINLALFELATNGYTDGYGFDLTGATTPKAWPVVTMSYLYLDKSAARTTCATKKTMVWKEIRHNWERCVDHAMLVELTVLCYLCSLLFAQVEFFIWSVNSDANWPIVIFAII